MYVLAIKFLVERNIYCKIKKKGKLPANLHRHIQVKEISGKEVIRDDFLYNRKSAMAYLYDNHNAFNHFQIGKLRKTLRD